MDVPTYKKKYQNQFFFILPKTMFSTIFQKIYFSF